MTLNHIAQQIKSAKTTTRPILIGIEGYGGSGKSTFAKKLSGLLGNSYVINFDDFIIKNKISDSDKSGFDKQRLEKQVLLPAKNNQPIAYQKLLWDDNTLSAPISVPDVDYLIIEGVSCCHPSVEKYYDFKIWVDTPIDIAKERGRQRDRKLGNNNDKLWEIWAKSDLEYQAKYHPEQKADFIYNPQ